jgi:ankyrin repeat protein
LTPTEQEAQLDTLRALVDAGIDVRAQDVDGNTALHYLAVTLNVDPRAMQLLRDMDAGEEVYHHALNREGLSPRALWESRSL